MDQYGVPIENQPHYGENYVGLNDLNTSIHQGIEFSFDETTEEPTESDLGSADGDQLGEYFATFSPFFDHDSS